MFRDRRTSSPPLSTSGRDRGVNVVRETSKSIMYRGILLSFGRLVNDTPVYIFDEKRWKRDKGQSRVKVRVNGCQLSFDP